MSIAAMTTRQLEPRAAQTTAARTEFDARGGRGVGLAKEMTRFAQRCETVLAG